MEKAQKSSEVIQDVPREREGSHLPVLISVTQRTFGAETVQTVDGRDIHTFLGIGKDYSNWIKAQLRRGRFVEGRDFIRHTDHGVITNAQKGVKPKSPIVSGVSYHMTFDAAKHVAMMSNAEKGHEVREYFIAKEKELQSLTSGGPVFLDQYPELRAITDMARSVMALAASTAEARTIAEHAQVEVEQAKLVASQANAKAEQAMHGQAWMTIHQFVTIYELARQMPQSFQQEYARYLIGYCAENNLRIYPQPVAYQRWQNENAYYVEAIRDTLPHWLNRRNGQIELRVV